MNSPEQPLSSDALDELLSADIDGELDRAATELGFTPEAARAALEASPESGSRRDALVRARALLAASPALAPDAEERLVVTALARSADERLVAPRPITTLPTHRFRNGMRALAGVGTAVAVIAGVIVLAGTNPAGQKSMSASKSASDSATTTPERGGDQQAAAARKSVAFGDVTSVDALQAKVRARLALPASAPTPTTKHVQSSTGTTIVAAQKPPAYGQSTDKGNPEGNYTADSASGFALRQSCISELGQTRRLASAPVLSGSGTSDAEPVFVVVYSQPTAYAVYVLSTADCSVVSRHTIPR